ncbi:hypothetical protein J5N97_029601 [Dioscorea zingiberensis]|uniref:Retrotransposon Copia-like N-terminal domain-containing protein n=1 Tax=Dioscorea zingiberensis TaxID=325984 RepID=A0A9D5H3D0_9LILI|nr:hypothetical protein J5N97_029601 [Dioscorea zingiberensis]
MTNSSSSSSQVSTGAGLLPLLSNLTTPTPSFGHLINIKLTHDNYLLWKAQMIPYLRSQQLLGYTNGTVQAPARMITQGSDTGTTLVENPEYHKWMQQDQMVLSALLASLSEEILSQVLFLTTSHKVWSSLKQSFTSRSRARIMQLKIQLSTVQKKEILVLDYFHKVKHLSGTLATIGQPLQDDESLHTSWLALGQNLTPW